MSNFYLKAKNVETLKTLITAVSILADEATLKLDADGVHVRVMDPSRVAMVDAVWPKNVFEEYQCPAPMKLTCNLAELMKLLKRGNSKTDSVVLEPTESGKLQVIIKSNSPTAVASASSRRFTLPTLENSEEDIPEPKVPLSTKVKLLAETFAQTIEDANTVTDHVKISVENGQMQMFGVGDLMAATITLQKEQGIIDLESTAPSHATYSNTYLSEISKVAQAGSVVTVEFATDMPIKMSFAAFLTENQDAKLAYFLAPRIETE